MLYSDPREASEAEACLENCLELTVAFWEALNVVKRSEAVGDLASVVRRDRTP
jgi:hypothetical protein